MAVMTAMVIHFPLAIVYGLILGWAIRRLEMGASQQLDLRQAPDAVRGNCRACAAIAFCSWLLC